MDKLTGLAIHCIDGIIPSLAEQREICSDRIGLIVGSAQGSMDSIVRFTYDTLAHERADYVNPALFPNTVMNCPAGQSAIWHGLKGPNATISSGELSSFAAINYAISLLKNNYADTLIAGGIEELSEVSIAANTKLAEKLGVSTKFSEGCSFFVIENAEMAKRYNRKIIAEVSAMSLGFNSSVNQPDSLAKLMTKVLVKANVDIADVDIICLAASWPQTREVELAAIDCLLGDRLQSGCELVESFQLHGNSVSSHNALQLSVLTERISEGAYGLLIAQDLKGNIGAMVVKGGRP